MRLTILEVVALVGILRRFSHPVVRKKTRRRFTTSFAMHHCSCVSTPSIGTQSAAIYSRGVSRFPQDLARNKYATTPTAKPKEYLAVFSDRLNHFPRCRILPAIFLWTWLPGNILHLALHGDLGCMKHRSFPKPFILWRLQPSHLTHVKNCPQLTYSCLFQFQMTTALPCAGNLLVESNIAILD